MPLRKKKSLGQHFLSSKTILGKIAGAALINPNETILEIGPGEGGLTRELLVRGAKVIAVEKDGRLIPGLKQKFQNEIASGMLTLVHDDILQVDPRKIIQPAQNYKIVANIPYYITGAILRKFLGCDFQPCIMILLLQREVAERVIAKNGKENLLSLSVKVYGKPRLLFKIPRGAFSPPPKVDSAVISIQDISKKFFDTADEKIFFGLLRSGFKSRRKMLLNNLPFRKEKSLEILERASIDKKSRPENITLEQWRKIASL